MVQGEQALALALYRTAVRLLIALDYQDKLQSFVSHSSTTRFDHPRRD